MYLKVWLMKKVKPSSVRYLMCLETRWGLAPLESLINSPSPDECALKLTRKSGKHSHSHVIIMSSSKVHNITHIVACYFNFLRSVETDWMFWNKHAKRGSVDPLIPWLSPMTFAQWSSSSAGLTYQWLLCPAPGAAFCSGLWADRAPSPRLLDQDHSRWNAQGT